MDKFYTTSPKYYDPKPNEQSVAIIMQYAACCNTIKIGKCLIQTIKN